jgi:photosystem II stability/assembly factor-like uncharacterized protein
MKTLKFLICFSFTISILIYSQPVYKYSDIFFLNNTHGWILGTQNFIWKTSNAGVTWSAIFDNRINSWGEIFFLDEQNGWMLLDTKLYSSKDGGNNWTFKYQFLEPTGVTSQITFINDSVGFIVKSKLFKTINSGNSWESILDTLPDISCVSFYNDQLGFTGTNQTISYLYKTTDLGSSWIFSNEVGNYDGAGFLKIQILSNDEVYVSSWYADWIAIGLMQKSTNQGATWKNIGSLNFGISDFEFKNKPYGWMLSPSGTISGTYNGGLNWSTLHYSTTIYNFEFFDSNLSYGISQDHIYITNDGWSTYSVADSIVTGVGNENYLSNNFTLHQNYPNPFNPSTVIKYELPKNSWVTLKIYNVLGEEVQTLVSSEKEHGIHEAAFDASTLSSGIYIYNLRAGEFVESKKMLLLR